MSSLKRLASDTAWYGLSTIFGRLISYFLVPFYTSKGILEPDEYGILRDLMGYVAFLNIIFTFGMETTYFRFASQISEKKVFNQTFTVITAISLLISVLMILGASSIANVLGYPGRGDYITWIALIIASDAIMAIPFAQLRWEKKPRAFAFARLMNIGINVGLNIFFLLICKNLYENTPSNHWAHAIYNPDIKVGYILLSNLIANGVLFVILYKPLLSFRPVLDKPLLKQMIVYAYPIAITGFAGQFNFLADIFFIKYYLPENFYQETIGPVEEPRKYMLGVYNACIKFSIFMALVVQAYRYAAEPFFFSKAKDKNAPQLFADTTKYFTILSGLIVLGVCTNLDWLQYILLRSEKYRIGLEIVPFALMAHLFLGVYFNLTTWFKLTNRTYYGTYITLVGMLVTIVANLGLIPVLGIMGCAMASLLTYLSMTILCYIWGQKFYPIPYDIFSMGSYIALSAGLITLSLMVKLDSGWLNFLIKNSLVVMYAGVVWMLERKKLYQIKNAL